MKSGRNMKRAAVLLMVLALMAPMLPGRTVEAAIAGGDDGISLMSVNGVDIRVTLSIGSKDGIAECSGSVTAAQGTTKITGTLQLNKGNSMVKTWNVTSYSDTLSVKRNCYVFSKGKFTLVLKVKVTRNGKTETVSASKTVTRS